MSKYEFTPGAVIVDGERIPARYEVRPGRVVIIPEDTARPAFDIPETALDYMDAWTIADAAARAAAEPVQPSAPENVPEPVQPSAPVQDPEQRPETISADAEPVQPSAPVPRFTTRSMMIGEKRYRVHYALNEDAALEISGELESGKAFSITIKPDEPHYAAARAAYEEKAAKRAKYEAEKPDAPDKWFIGQELKGPGWTIKMDGSIGRATVTFKRKPDAATRELVKAAGFYWSPAHKQWSRGLTHKAWRAAQDLYTQLRTGKRPETISA